jgi:hypothetical protein
VAAIERDVDLAHIFYPVPFTQRVHLPTDKKHPLKSGKIPLPKALQIGCLGGKIHFPVRMYIHGYNRVFRSIEQVYYEHARQDRNFVFARFPSE